jgi:hypothetical protein
MLLNNVRAITGKYFDVCKAMPFRQFDLVLQQGPPSNRDHWLRQVPQAGAQTASHPARENQHLLHD